MSNTDLILVHLCSLALKLLMYTFFNNYFNINIERNIKIEMNYIKTHVYIKIHRKK